MRRLLQASLLALVLFLILAPAAFAQGGSDSDRIIFGGDETVSKGETARDVIVFGGNVTMDGTATRDVVVFGGKGIAPVLGFEGYKPLVEQIATFFRTRTPPVANSETIEIIDGQIDVASRPKKKATAELHVVIGGTSISHNASANRPVATRSRKASDAKAQVMVYGVLQFDVSWMSDTESPPIYVHRIF